jgi:tetratricopeptide (TPR) repeat protein
VKWLNLAVSAAVIGAAVMAIRYVSWTPVRCHALTMTVADDMDRMRSTTDPIRLTVAARENIARLEPCRRAVPWNINLHLLVAENYAARDMHEDAIRVYRDALRYDYRPEIYFNLGQELLKAGHLEEAIAPLTIACTINANLIKDIAAIDVQQRVLTLADHRAILPPLPDEPGH